MLSALEQICHQALKTFYCRGALGTLVNLDTIGCLRTGEFDLYMLRVDGECFEFGESFESGYVWMSMFLDK